MEMKKNKILTNKHKGFTLVEVMVAMFIFVLMMVAITEIFVSFIRLNRHTRAVQQDLEDAEYAMNIIAKTLRTSSIVDVSGGKDSIEVFDYSQSKCIGYDFSGGNLRVRTANPSTANDPTTCDAPLGGASYQNMTNNGNILVSESGFVRKVETNLVSGLGTVGSVTMVVTVQEANSTDKARVQTSVSLHDYSEVGP